MKDFTFTSDAKRSELKTVLFVTLDTKVLDKLNSMLLESDYNWADITKQINLISIFPKDEKNQYDLEKLIFRPSRSNWYDPVNPFAVSCDVLGIILSEF